jgi:small-conductance mechanosensitive channel
MTVFSLKTIETLVVVALYIILRFVYNKLVNRRMTATFINSTRGQIIRRALNLISLIIAVLAISTIWGVRQADLLVFIGSVLTIIGVALFAQWSHLSNITSSIIIFFNHSVKIGDTIQIMEAKDYEIEGKVISIGLFFVELQTTDGKEISLPNNIFIQKMIKKDVDDSFKI